MTYLAGVVKIESADKIGIFRVFLYIRKIKGQISESCVTAVCMALALKLFDLCKRLLLQCVRFGKQLGFCGLVLCAVSLYALLTRLFKQLP